MQTKSFPVNPPGETRPVAFCDYSAMPTAFAHRSSIANSRHLPAARLALACLLMLITALARSMPGPFPVCLDFHCDQTRQVALSDEEWRGVAALFADQASPDAERARIREAVATMERLVGEKAGTWRDLAENRTGAGGPGQLDCIAESMNSTTYLRLFEQAGWLRWHSVEPRARRQRWLFMIHWTAVIRDTQSGVRYAVDSWYRDNGLPPVTPPLDDWFRSDGLPDA